MEDRYPTPAAPRSGRARDARGPRRSGACPCVGPVTFRNVREPVDLFQLDFGLAGC